MHKCGQRPMRPPKDSERHDQRKDYLLVIKLKDKDSVPEVYYEGQKLKGGLRDILYHYHITLDEFVNGGKGVNDVLFTGNGLYTEENGRWP